MQTFHIHSMTSKIDDHHASADDISEDRDLLSQLARGDAQAFATLYTRYTPRIRSYLHQRLTDPEHLDEVLNDVMLVLWQKATDCPSTVPLLAWLYGIARNKARSCCRPSVDQKTFLSEFASEEAEPEVHLLKKDRQQTLDRAIAKLPHHERQPIELLVYHGCSYKDIATRLEVSVNTIKTRMRRAQDRLVAACSSEGQLGSGLERRVRETHRRYPQCPRGPSSP
ncbi:MAG: hypothetical protein ETSY2_48765 [Candidatus Entotheonella gemina]|uniref:HTH luxR-type domain-containing protein n=1 Tax=Candidatus Entotheonella gemina TaxID=1429439 RepID=W4LAQ8_9BACT|nr:MAG: hypothetical protein ETSY2_48765 [Candidatus Entotheonella gemina]